MNQPGRPSDASTPPPDARSPDLEARALIEIAHTLDSTIDQCQRLTRTLTLLKNLLGGDRCSLLSDFDGDGQRRMLSVPPLAGDDVRNAEGRLLALLHAIEDNQPLPRDSGGQVLALPLVGLDEVRGMLAIERGTTPFTADDMRLFSVVAAQLGGYLAMLRLHRDAVALDQFKREMSALAAHDIKNPLAAVIGMVDFLGLELGGSPDRIRNCLGHIRGACNRIHRVTANLLDLSRLETNQLPLRLVPLDATSVLSMLAQHRTAQAAVKNVCIQTRPTPPGPRILADEDLFARVIDNLLDNALRYVPPDGRIELLASRVGDRVQVRVGNDGPPIAPDACPTIFDKFVRIGDPGPLNLGLGLYFARIAIEAQGGRIWLERTEDLPTVFGLELPSAEPPSTTS